MSYKKTKESGISKRQLKNKTWVYYASYRDKDTGKVVRKKIGGIKEGINDAFEAKLAFRALKEKSQEVDEEQSVTVYTLHNLSKLYFADRRKIIRENFILNFGEQILTTVDEDSVFKEKMQAVKAEENRFKNHIQSHPISSIPIKDIQLRNIKHFKEYLVTRQSIPNPRLKKAQKKRELSTKTKHFIYALAKTIWSYGIDTERIRNENLFLNKNISRQMKNPKTIRIRTLNNLEKKQLVYELNKLPYKNPYYVAKIGLITGARAKSVLGIRRRDINLKNCTITLNNFKTNKTYDIPFSEAYKSFFQKLFDDVKPEPHEHIIQPRRKSMYKQTALRNIPIEYFETCNRLFNKNLDMTDNYTRNNLVVGFHTLRHTVLTELANSDVPLHFIRQFANHSSLDSTLRYIKSDTEQMRGQLDKLSRFSFFDEDFDQEYDKKEPVDEVQELIHEEFEGQVHDFDEEEPVFYDEKTGTLES